MCIMSIMSLMLEKPDAFKVHLFVLTTKTVIHIQ